MQISSGIAYHNYLAGRHFIEALGEDSVHIASYINIFVLTFLFVRILKLESEGSLQDVAGYYKNQITLTKSAPIKSEEKIKYEDK